MFLPSGKKKKKKIANDLILLIQVAGNMDRSSEQSEHLSLSQELYRKGIRCDPFAKHQGNDIKEVALGVIRARFDRIKQEVVNNELSVFAAKLCEISEKNRESCNPEWQESMELLKNITDSSAKASPDEFRLQCMDIVQTLDDRCDQLSDGMLWELHHRLFYILARCSRLLALDKSLVEETKP
ncbi:hypothetical protein RND81_07G169100 [Saponaria officinalis]